MKPKGLCVLHNNFFVLFALSFFVKNATFQAKGHIMAHIWCKRAHFQTLLRNNKNSTAQNFSQIGL